MADFMQPPTNNLMQQNFQERQKELEPYMNDCLKKLKDISSDKKAFNIFKERFANFLKVVSDREKDLNKKFADKYKHGIELANYQELSIFISDLFNQVDLLDKLPKLQDFIGNYGQDSANQILSQALQANSDTVNDLIKVQVGQIKYNPNGRAALLLLSILESVMHICEKLAAPEDSIPDLPAADTDSGQTLLNSQGKVVM